MLGIYLFLDSVELYGLIWVCTYAMLSKEMECFWLPLSCFALSPSCFWTSSKRGCPLSPHVFELPLNRVAFSPFMILELLLNGVALSPLMFLNFFWTGLPSLLPSCFITSSRLSIPLFVEKLQLNIISLNHIYAE